MNRQKGISSLAMVLLILLLGTLLLAGHNQQLNALLSIVIDESLATRQQAAAHSAMEWARMLAWQPPTERQCHSHPSQPWWACLRPTGAQTLLLSAGSGDVTLWRLGNIVSGDVQFSPHGWSDFCPVKEVALCQRK